jgi:hypothetical protein
MEMTQASVFLKSHSRSSDSMVCDLQPEHGVFPEIFGWPKCAAGLGPCDRSLLWPLRPPHLLMHWASLGTHEDHVKNTANTDAQATPYPLNQEFWAGPRR